MPASPKRQNPKPPAKPPAKGNGKQPGKGKDKGAGKPPKVELTEEQKRAKAITDLVGEKNAKGAEAMTETFFPEGSLGRVSSGFDKNGNRIDENDDLLKRARATMEVYGPGGAARRTADTQSVIDRSRANLDRSQATSSFLSDSRAKADRSGETKDYLSRLNESTKGYDSVESQAMLEQSNRGVTSDYQAANARLARTAGNSGVRGGTIAAAQGLNDRALARTQAQNRQDVTVKNIDEKQRRLNQYGDAVGAAETSESNRLDQYGNQLGLAEEADRARLAENSTYVNNAEANEYDRMRQTSGDYQNLLAGTRQDELNRQKDNLDRVAAERAGQSSTYFNTIEAANAEKDKREQRKLAKGNLDLAKSMYGRSGRGKGDGRNSGTGSPAGPDVAGYVGAAQNAIRNS